MPYIPLEGKNLVMVVAISVLLAMVPLVYVALFEAPQLVQSVRNIGAGVVIISSVRINALIFASLVLGFIPYSIVDFFNRKYLDAIDRDLGPFFKGLAEAIRAGMPFVKALESVAKITPGPLGREMKKAVVLVEMGMSLPEALERFAMKVKLPSVQRAVTIMITAYMSGGKVVDVLDSAAEMYSLLRSYEEEKRTQISPYAWIVYMAIGIFLFISFILIYAFFAPLQQLMMKTQAIFSTSLDVEAYKNILFYTVALESIFGGLIVGKLRTGSASSGLKHSALLLTLTIVFFVVMELYGAEIKLFPTFKTPGGVP